MSMRISSLALLGVLLLGACHRGDGASEIAAQQEAREDGGERIACAHGNAELAQDCTVDRTEGENGLVLTVRHPDGAFRRLLVATDGRGVVAADGAQPARVTVVGNAAIDVAIGGDRYRLPATIGKAGS